MKRARAKRAACGPVTRGLAAGAACALLTACAPLGAGTSLPSHMPAVARVSSNPGFTSHSVRYRCSQSETLEVAYLNLADGRAFAALHHDGRTALLQSRPTASGARYIALDEQHSLRWNTRGAEGQLAFMAADHTATERPLLRDCRALPNP